MTGSRSMSEHNLVGGVLRWCRNRDQGQRPPNLDTLITRYAISREMPHGEPHERKKASEQMLGEMLDKMSDELLPSRGSAALQDELSRVRRELADLKKLPARQEGPKDKKERTTEASGEASEDEGAPFDLGDFERAGRPKTLREAAVVSLKSAAVSEAIARLGMSKPKKARAAALQAQLLNAWPDCRRWSARQCTPGWRPCSQGGAPQSEQ